MFKLWVFIHILSAMFWIGGMLFMVAVLVPVSRKALFEGRKGEFFQIVGTQFSRISWGLFILLLFTGLMSLNARGFAWHHIFSGGFWQTAYGKTLMGKLHFFSLILTVSGIHDFYIGPKAAKLMDSEPKSLKTRRFRKISSWLGRVNLLLGLAVVYYAISLVRG